MNTEQIEVLSRIRVEHGNTDVDEFAHWVPVVIGFGCKISLREDKDEGYIAEVHNTRNETYYIFRGHDWMECIMVTVKAAFRDILTRQGQ